MNEATNESPLKNMLSVYKGGPNHGIVMPAMFDPNVRLKSLDLSQPPAIGGKIMTMPHWAISAIGLGHFYGKDQVQKAWDRVGVVGHEGAVYQVESVDDGIIVWAYQGSEA